VTFLDKGCSLVINSMAEDIMEKKDGASVCARVWKAGGMREREIERERPESVHHIQGYT
jgi:hypothetical protein